MRVCQLSSHGAAAVQRFCKPSDLIVERPRGDDEYCGQSTAGQHRDEEGATAKRAVTMRTTRAPKAAAHVERFCASSMQRTNTTSPTRGVVRRERSHCRDRARRIVRAREPGPSSVAARCRALSPTHWQVEPKSKEARPTHHRNREAIDAHLTIVFAALAVPHHIQQRTGLAIAGAIKQLRPCDQPPSNPPVPTTSFHPKSQPPSTPPSTPPPQQDPRQVV